MIGVRDIGHRRRAKENSSNTGVVVSGLWLQSRCGERYPAGMELCIGRRCVMVFW
jgi:hypothetical protein